MRLSCRQMKRKRRLVLVMVELSHSLEASLYVIRGEIILLGLLPDVLLDYRSRRLHLPFCLVQLLKLLFFSR